MNFKPQRADQYPSPIGAGDSLILVQNGKVVCTISKQQGHSALGAARALCRASAGDVVVYEAGGKSAGSVSILMSAAIDSSWREIYRVTATSLRNARSADVD